MFARFIDDDEVPAAERWLDCARKALKSLVCVQAAVFGLERLTDVVEKNQSRMDEERAAHMWCVHPADAVTSAQLPAAAACSLHRSCEHVMT
jgi:hypothetical protein